MLQYALLQEETRCLYYEPTYTEQDAQNVYNSNIELARGRYVDQSHGRAHARWPGDTTMSMDKYIVAILRWNPPMSSWDWQAWTTVVPDEKAQIVMSAQDQTAADAANAALDRQIQDIPVPGAEEPPTKSRASTIIFGSVVGALAFAGVAAVFGAKTAAQVVSAGAGAVIGGVAGSL